MAPREACRKNSLTPFHWPSCSSRASPFSTGWLGPVGAISLAALQSIQLYAPHSPVRSGLITQTWVGAND